MGAPIRIMSGWSFSWIINSGFNNVMQLFARRSKYVPPKLRKCWDRLTLHYMSEEEDMEDGDVLLVKKSYLGDLTVSGFLISIDCH